MPDGARLVELENHLLQADLSRSVSRNLPPSWRNFPATVKAMVPYPLSHSLGRALLLRTSEGTVAGRLVHDGRLDLTNQR